MRIKGIVITLMTLAIIGFYSCEKEQENESETFKLSDTKYKGCFTSSAKDLSFELDADTLYYTITGDTLTLSVKMNYNCCGKLKDSIVFENQKMNIYVSDTCTANCLCFCTCNFEFEYDIVNFWQQNIYFSVYLKGLGENTYSLWRETEFICNQN